ncbi:MAG: CopG family transcriptional regulator [Acidimicrobiales bacterium]
MTRTQTLVQLNDTLLALLDQRAAKRGVSRSQVIREAVEAYLGSDYESEISRQILAGYE